MLHMSDHPKAQIDTVWHWDVFGLIVMSTKHDIEPDVSTSVGIERRLYQRLCCNMRP